MDWGFLDFVSRSLLFYKVHRFHQLWWHWNGMPPLILGGVCQGRKANFILLSFFSLFRKSFSVGLPCQASFSFSVI